MKYCIISIFAGTGSIHKMKSLCKDIVYSSIHEMESETPFIII